ncbi:methyl-accepting chemotaxis protein [Limobrevibacterium gyesilva]|uniref:Methyl-accepting chemotaxis protein n=1 Tax=Limobrevibacterium gyesilva TaxID=2991712 RepID=A0AA42CGW7_9PROT|nr:methyl-accepting chemotaxis protein [Limobrevibacterium gyesilva]MCW3474392.1 methyl-accepting chemotaxis protein [Limobrevibacterium gyesilva]
MRLLRNLSIAGKLGLASLATLLLVGVLAWSVLSAMAAQRALDDRMSDAYAAERSVQKALVFVRGMRLASLESQFRQTPETVSDSATAADGDARRARDLLDELAAAADGDAQQALRRALASLDAYRSMIRRTAELRTEVLTERDTSFMTLQARFDSAVQAVRRGLPLEDLMPSEVEEMQEHLRLYQSAILTMRDATNRFLATGDNGLLEKVAAADASAEANLPGLLQARISDDFRETVNDMASAGKNMRQSARRLFDNAAALVEFIANQADPASAAVEAHLGAAVAQFGDRAGAAMEEATAGQMKARRDLLLLIGGIVVMLVLSGYVTAHAVGRPIAAMTHSVQRMAEGETDLAIGYAGRRDEVGRMAAALEVLRQAVRRAFLQSQMIEQIPVGVMTVDPEGAFPITYMNAETRRVLGLVQDRLPVPVDQVVGSSVDMFHRDPAHIRGLLSDPDRLPHRARIRLGAETLEVNVSALRAADGSYAGPMLAWHVTTAQARLSERFEQSVAGVVDVVGRSAEDMRQTATEMTGAAEASGRRLGVVASASRDATGNVQAVAASAEELAHSVEEIARQVAESAVIAGQAVSEAEATDRCVTGLSEAAARIGDVVKLIGDIAGRTNLLALNATIEAARAGEAGRGFAVVANEVKTLATQTAKATGEIAAQITAMQGATGQAVTALRSIAATIQRMNEIATAIAGAVEEQGAATQEIARAVQQAAAGTAEVDGNISEVTDAVQLTGTQANEVVGAAERLSEQSGRLSQEVAEFLRAMQAA